MKISPNRRVSPNIFYAYLVVPGWYFVARSAFISVLQARHDKESYLLVPVPTYHQLVRMCIQ